MGTLRKKIHLLLIDPQNDFTSSGNNGAQQGALFVPGANVDMQKLAHLVERLGNKLDDIHVTLDSHQLLHIANPGFWRNDHGDRPSPFTQITAKDAMSGVWNAVRPSYQDRAVKYLQRLESTNRFTHTIWPEHTLIGSWGHNVDPTLEKTIRKWCLDRFATVDWVTKGSSVMTEHFSAIQAEVPDPKDPSTQINTNLISALEQADEIVIAGEALSHCVNHTIRDIANNFKNSDYIKKFVFLTDCSSNVPGFEKHGQDFLTEMQAKGMQVTTSDKYLV